MDDGARNTVSARLQRRPQAGKAACGSVSMPSASVNSSLNLRKCLSIEDRVLED